MLQGDPGAGTICDDPQPFAAAWLFPSGSDPARLGVARVVNRSGAAGEVTVTATDDAGRSYPPLTLGLNAGAVAHFDSRDLEAGAAVGLDAHDLEFGNAAKGLSGNTGGSGSGARRLALSSDGIEFDALAYVRAWDGFLTPMQATAPSAGRDPPR